MNTLIKLENITKTYIIGSSRLDALKSVNLTISEGNFMVLAGKSGSGKSTLLNILGCLDIPTEGRVIFQGTDTATLSDKELSALRFHKIGFIFQSYNLLPSLNVLDNIMIGIEIGPHCDRRKREEYRAKAAFLIETLGLKGWEKHKPDELSGGQKQRVAIARALVKEPALVLADEPTANLDTDTGNEIISLMKTLNKNLNTSFVIATHDPEIIQGANLVHHLKDGVLT